jgi:hypothetical protein
MTVEALKLIFKPDRGDCGEHRETSRIFGVVADACTLMAVDLYY